MKSFWLLFAAALGFSIWFGGCQGTKPVSPSRVIALKVSIPQTNELSSSLLNAGSNELLYRVEGPDMTPIKATLGPFATASASGSIDFSLEIPGGGGKRLLSLQLNDGGTHLPLAIGATEIDLTGSLPVTDIVVQLGSVIRNCYNVNTATYSGATLGVNGNTFVNSATTYGPYDFAIGAVGTGFQIVDAEGNTGPYNAATVAYLGNGDYVDFDKVPPDTDFYSQSSASKLAAGVPVTTAQVNDIYCVKLLTVPNGHAWVQIKSAGLPALSGATLNFRVNDSLPFFGYYQTAADLAGSCPAQ